MKNFTFVGKQIKGGKLAGKIIIASQVINEIRDVILAAGTTIQGKQGKEFVTAKLAGKIAGDATDPALLENVTIEDGAKLENVVLGEGVVLGQNVKQKNVVMVCTNKRANGKGFGKDSSPFDDNQTCFAVQQNAVALTLEPTSNWLGQTAEQLFVVVQGKKAFMFTDHWQDWKDGELGTLQSGHTLTLNAVQTLALPDLSQFAGDFKLYAGLRLKKDGTVLYYPVQ
ncbi:MAG: hypothetical protein BWK79_15380 [Beggiatoa sp. IS2]|nr:MAG: hypothetical protein BWK79_15380 [Beggiatoa sp. IS2]